ISTSAIIGFGGISAQLGMGMMFLAMLTILVGIFIAFVFFGKPTRKLGHELDAHTFPQLMNKRYDSPYLQKLMGSLIFISMPFYAASVMIGGTNMLSEYFGINANAAILIFVVVVAAYTLTGGLKSIMYTSAMQAGILFLAMIGLIFTAYTNLGGVTAAHEGLTALYQKPDVQEAMAKLTAGGFRGWTAMPAAGSPIWWSLVSSLILGVGIGVLAQPQLIVRFMTIKSGKELNRAVLSGGIFILSMTGVIFMVGVLSNSLLYERFGQVAFSYVGGKVDKIIPVFITNYMPSWYGALFLIAMVAAAMSTLSSQFHTMGAAAGTDIYQVITGREDKALTVNRYSTFLVIIISSLIALLFTHSEMGNAFISKGTILFFEMTTVCFLPPYFAALYSKKVSRRAVEIQVTAGAVLWLMWSLLLGPNAKVLGVCHLIFGKSSLIEGSKLASVGATVAILPVSILILAVAAMAENRQPAAGKVALES
ncbi:MAG: sodium:solute symporter family protein, partial [Spirochaetales bacterium]|nr:sodium:solute symporter family protein [Spirochaetales bacterium]